MNGGEPLDHPSVQKYPDSPTVEVRVGGILYRVPTQRGPDEAVPVPVRDLAQAMAAVAQFAALLELAMVDDEQATWGGRAVTRGTSEGAPTTRPELVLSLQRLSRRLRAALPYW
ncbi:hypothetical protein H9L10_11705 [Phycicoccus endophyticus]|uniref:Uncharacterized protein n=1 Tax=Phycicoccus endophyticus TaxID=1690220 RepID=A0A7G9R003_9MICO|nr:hypothetical protein [Phycicoccus endophyticus]NHI20788.1 hypothetical protein [Phycicoccus endophyticus]QNN48928.1 hypothetical protein H9L10_11705 [Phycicoccus endophyticus]GGL43904.1 hypothetical protein GCM10012283_28160 [Phycicoccus endophyticus]